MQYGFRVVFYFVARGNPESAMAAAFNKASKDISKGRTAFRLFRWLDEYYGGLEIQAASNIVFSNGLLDPWTSGGVTANLSKTVVSVVLELGAHHLDLMFEDPNDPPCARAAREVEEANVRRWIAEGYAEAGAMRGAGRSGRGRGHGGAEL